MIKLVNVSKEFHNNSQVIYALKDVSLEVEKGDIFGIIGFSGAGKSTLLRCLNRLEEPTTGDIYVNNQNITQLTPPKLRDLRKDMGMIFQSFALMQRKTVSQNIALAFKLAGHPIDQAKIDELLELVELTDKKHHYPSQLSGGQKQRVGIARSLVTNPSILLCDEATSALDPRTTQSILNLLAKINKTLGVTIVLITHEMDVIKQICNKVAVMENGQILECGDVSHVFSAPKHPTTKQFAWHTGKDLPAAFLSDDNKHLLVRLTYKQDKVGTALLSQVIKQFDIDANILQGGIDALHDAIIGNLIVEFSGEKEEIYRALTYIELHGGAWERVNDIV